jgi:F-type H+-transporting ATPase subunit gamma
MTSAAQEVLLAVDRARRQGAGTVTLCHQRPRGSTGSQPHEVQLLPMTRERLAQLRAERWPSRTLPMHTLERGRLFPALVRQLIFVGVYRALAESLASECAARLASMQAAEKNIDERLETLRSAYHQQRQTAVTAELLDIVSGFEALLGGR